jgi:hypothetical protein
MRLFASLAVLLLASAIARAQDDGSPMMFTPAWETQPSAAEIIRHFPSHALQQNISGIAILCCDANADRSVACRVSSEFPAGQGFGDASVQASHGYRLTQQSHDDLVGRPGTQVRLSMIWTGPVILPATLDDLRRRDAESMEACLPAAPQ